MYIDIRIYCTPKPLHGPVLASSPHGWVCQDWSKPRHEPHRGRYWRTAQGDWRCRLGILILFATCDCCSFEFILQYYSSNLPLLPLLWFQKSSAAKLTPPQPSLIRHELVRNLVLVSHVPFHPPFRHEWCVGSHSIFTSLNILLFPTPPAHSKTRSQTKGNSRAISLPWICRESHQMFFVGGKSTFEVFKFLQCVNGKFWRNTWQQGKPLWNHILTRWQLFQNQVKTGGNTSWDCNLNCTFHKAKDLLFGAWLLQIQCQLNTVNQMIYDDT